MAAHAERQGELLGSNFLRSLKNQPLNPYKTGNNYLFLSLHCAKSLSKETFGLYLFTTGIVIPHESF